MADKFRILPRLKQAIRVIPKGYKDIASSVRKVVPKGYSDIATASQNIMTAPARWLSKKFIYDPEQKKILPQSLARFQPRGDEEIARQIAQGKRWKDLPKELTDPYTRDIAGLAMGLTGGVKAYPPKPTPKAFEGLDELSLKTVEKLKGTRTVSRKTLMNMSNQPDLKQPERDLIRRLASEIDDKMPTQKFADKVKSELLPLKANKLPGETFLPDEMGGVKEMSQPRYESTSLSPELRGNIANYGEHIYQSPIKTSAGDIHFNEARFPNYFAHTRVEDLARGAYESADTLGGQGNTRRVIELQSDLFQKGRLEKEAGWQRFLTGKYGSEATAGYSQLANVLPEGEANKLIRLTEKNPAILSKSENIVLKRLGEKAEQIANKKGLKRISQLQPYRNTWHERIIKEEIKRAAQDGKTKLQFPTGETAMKIEGLGETTIWYGKDIGELTTRDLKAGLEIGRSGRADMPGEVSGDAWIITDVLDEGKFKAWPKHIYENIKAWKVEPWHGGYYAKNNKTGDVVNYKTRAEAKKYISDRKSMLSRDQETFDISGKVDTSNPIYRFYQKTVHKFLKRLRPDMKQVTDPQGVKWFETNITKEDLLRPVTAFSILGMLGTRLMGEDKQPSTIKKMLRIIPKKK